MGNESFPTEIDVELIFSDVRPHSEPNLCQWEMLDETLPHQDHTHCCLASGSECGHMATH